MDKVLNYFEIKMKTTKSEMIFNSQHPIFLFLILLFIILNNGCGVKGRPLPPEYPPYIGHGLIEESSNENLNKSSADPSEASKEGVKKLDVPEQSTIPSPNSKNAEVKSKKKSPLNKSKEKKQ